MIHVVTENQLPAAEPGSVVKMGNVVYGVQPNGDWVRVESEKIPYDPKRGFERLSPMKSPDWWARLEKLRGERYVNYLKANLEVLREQVGRTVKPAN